MGRGALISSPNAWMNANSVGCSLAFTSSSSLGLPHGGKNSALNRNRNRDRNPAPIPMEEHASASEPFPAATAKMTRLIGSFDVQRRLVAADPLRGHLWGHLQNVRDKIV